MPRARDLGIGIGTLPAGPTNSVLDVEGVGLGHATLTHETARTGVTSLVLAEDAYLRPLVAGAAGSVPIPMPRSRARGMALILPEIGY